MDIGKSFFPGQRLKLTLENYTQLAAVKPTETQPGRGKRKKLAVSMEFDGERVAGMPTWIFAGYEALATDDNHGARFHYAEDTMMERLTVTMYMQSDSPHQWFEPLASSVIEKLRWKRLGKEEKARFYLEFFITVTDTENVHTWCKENFGGTFHATFDQPQGSLFDAPTASPTPAVVDVKEDEEPDTDDDDKDDEEEESYMGKEHDDDFRTTPLKSVRSRKTLQ